MKPLVWQETYRVEAHAARPGGDIHLADLFRILQDAAASHARARGFSILELEPLGLSWALLRFSLVVDRFPRWPEEITVETWPSGIQGRFATRDFLLLQDGKPIGAATSTWITIHLQTRRAAPLPDPIRAVHLHPRPRALEVPRLRLGVPDRPPDGTASFRVYPTDLDMNGHANSARMLEWLLAPAFLLTSRQPSRLDLEFRKEARTGMAVLAEVWRENHGFLHALRGENGELLALARTGECSGLPHCPFSKCMDHPEP